MTDAADNDQTKDPAPKDPASKEPAPKEPADELRLALAMSGGVSLAVWIGGACSEIELLCRDTDEFWQSMRELSGHDGIVVDVLSGASAGGLNAVLMAASAASGFEYSKIREVWLRLGSTRGMVRREAPWPSLFRGDGYFLSELYKAMDDLTRDQAAPEIVQQRSVHQASVQVRLSATLVEPVSRPVPGAPGEAPIDERRYGSGFTFQSPPYAFLDNALALDPARRERTLRRLALAGRSTSSFPGAFEAADVRSVRPPTYGSPRVEYDAPDIRPNMQGVFHESSPVRMVDGHSVIDDFVVSDGGILDNLPIGRSLDAIAAAPADSSTRRELLFLEPSGFTPRDTRPEIGDPAPVLQPLDARRSSFEVVKGVIGARIPEETIAEDVAAIEAHNEAVARADAARISGFAELEDRAGLLAAVGGELETYKLQRAQYDAQLVMRLLQDPLTVLGGDPFPGSLGPKGELGREWRAPLELWSRGQREDLARDVETALTISGRGAVLHRGGLPLARVTQLLIQWARFLETNGVEGAGAAKLELYRVLGFVRAAIDQVRQLGWVTAFVRGDIDPRSGPARGSPPASAGIVEWLDLLATTGDSDDLPSEAELPALIRSGDARLSPVVRACQVRLDRPAPSHHGADLRSVVLSTLIDIAEQLRTARPPSAMGTSGNPPPWPIGEPSGRNAGAAWCLDRVLGGSEPIVEGTLEALEIMCFSEFVTGLPCRRAVHFRRLSAGNPTPIAPAFGALFKAAQHQQLWWRAGTIKQADLEGIHVNLKLAGNELGHFSAFLLDKWRANDWMWGRLDAVPTLVDLLASDERLALCFAAPAAGDQRKQLEHLVLGDRHRKELKDLIWSPALDDLANSTSALPRKSFGTVRDAIVARRQWEIVAAEMELPTSAQGSPPGGAPSTGDPLGRVREFVDSYRVGAETLRDSGASVELVDRLAEISDAAGEVVLANVDVALGPKRSVPPRVRRIVRIIFSKVGRILARKATRETVAELNDKADELEAEADALESSASGAGSVAASVKEKRDDARRCRADAKRRVSSRRWWGIGLAVLAAAVVLGVIGFSLNLWAFVIGAAVGAVVVGLISVVVGRFLWRQVPNVPDPVTDPPPASPPA